MTILKNLNPPCVQSQIPNSHVLIARRNATAICYHRPSEDRAIVVEFLEAWSHLKDMQDATINGHALVSIVDATYLLLFLESSSLKREFKKERFLEVGLYLLKLCGNGSQQSLTEFEVAVASHPDATCKF